MQEPEPRLRAERPDPTGAWPETPRAAGGPASGSAPAGGGDPPTVRSGGSSARRARVEAGGEVPPLPRAGDQIDSFALEEAIGAGGMGAVFRALDVKLERAVALKILPPEQARDPEVVQRFYQEGRAAARLDNENIARVYTIDHDGVYHYIAFEYIEGTTIRQRVERNGPLPVGEAINYTLQIAAALVHAAERGVVHRDIKPSNIIVTPQGRAKLVDMGLARRFERGGDDGLTQSGMTLGTFDYISPEQARDPRDVDVRSDLYSLGCTLFHMLTGRPPFPEGTVLQKLIQHQENPPPDVRAQNPQVPADLAAILAKLMAKERDRRYQTPEQLVRDLLTVAGALGLRSVSPEGLVWISAARGAAWEGHLVWGVPTLALLAVVAVLVWWGQDAGAPPFRTAPSALAPAGEPASAPRPKLVEGPAPRADEPKAAVPRTAVPADDAPGPPPGLPRDYAVDSGEDLLAVLAQAPPRSIVVLTDDGPYLLGGGASDRLTIPRLSRRDLTLKAEAGVRPVLRLARDPGLRREAGPAALLDFVGGRVTLEGLKFVVDADDVDGEFAAVRARDTELTVRRCQFVRQGSAGHRGRLAALRVEATAPGGDRPSAVVAEACHFDGGQVALLAGGPADVLLRDCTAGGAGEPAVWIDNAGAPSPVAAELRLRHDSLLAPAGGPVFRFDGTAPRVRVDDSVIAAARDARATLVATDDPEGLEWRGRGNVYARIGPFLEPTGRRGGPGRGIADWPRWERADSDPRESGSSATDDRLWEEPDPAEAIAREAENPSRAFRLAAAHPGGAAVGARQGPFGSVPAAALIVASAAVPAEPRKDRPASAAPSATGPTPAADPPAPPAGLAPEAGPASGSAPAEPREPVSGPDGSGPADGPPGPRRMSDMPVMPIMPPMGREPSAAPRVASADEGRPAEAEDPGKERDRDKDKAGPAVLRTADQLRNALADPGARGSTLRLAAGSDWTVDSLVIRAAGPVRLRGETGGARPRIRFRPAPADPMRPASRPACFDLRSGSLQLEGIDLVLPRADAPAQGRWAAFAVGAGTDLSLNGCTVTVEGDRAASAVVAVRPPDDADEPEPEPADATVRLEDSLLRAGGDMADVAAGSRLVLEIDNAVVATGGSLVHAHGLPRGETPGPIRVTLRQVTARSAGGLVRLESAPGEPELPVASVGARDSILATTPQGDPLFRVDGQDALGALRDRIEWEGLRVAYHQINTYRRDQSAQVGAVPSLYDRSSWAVAAGPKESSPSYGKFLQDWDPTRPAWELRPGDVRLSPESPAASAGPDLQRIPEPPASEPSDT